jgi:hypothetical protein
MVRSNMPSGKFIGRIGLFLVIGAFGLTIAAAGTNAAGLSFMDSVKEFLGMQPVQTSAEMISAPATDIVGQDSLLSASDAVPILYYDFENNATRTTFENAVEQSVNVSNPLTLSTISGGLGVGGAGTFNGGAAAGQAITATNWSSATTDPGTAAANYFQFVTSTSGFSGISVTLDDQASATGPARVGLLYSTDGGTTFSAVSTVLTGNAAFATATFDLTGISAINNQGLVHFRIYGFAGSAGDRTGRSAFGATGSCRIDNLTVRANTVTASKTLLNYPAIGLSVKSGTAFTPTYGDFTVNGAGISATLASALQIGGTLTFTSGNIVTGANALTVTSAGSVSRTSGHVIGNLQKTVTIAGGAGSQTFEVGDASGYAPINFTTNSGATNVVLTGSTTAGDHPSIAGSGLDASKTANRYWTLTTNNPGSFSTANLTFNFNAGDLDGGANPLNFVVKKFDAPSTWASTTTGTVTSTSTQATAVSGFSDFQVGELAAGPTATNTNTATQTDTTTPTNTATSTSTSTATNTPTPVNPTTYTWNQTGTASWTTDVNWTPTRTTPLADDVLVFNNGAADTVTNVPTQTIAQLSVTGNTTVELVATAPVTLTVAGSAGTDLAVDAGSALNSQAALATTIAIATGATGSISGSMTFANGGHRLTAVDASSVTFNNGAVFTAGTAFSGNAFGTTNLNSIIFANGSTYVSGAGSNPFGASAPNAVAVFQAGSLYSHQQTGAPSFSGRTYSNVEINASGFNVSASGGNACVINNFTMTQGTLNFNLTGTPGHAIKGNISVATGATLNFNPASATTINLNGTSAQTISGAGTLTAASANSTFVVNNGNGITLARDLSLSGTLTFTNGRITTGANTLTIAQGGTVIRTNGHVIGNLKKTVTIAFNAGSMTFEVGDANVYAPVDFSTNSGLFTTTLTASTTGGNHPDIANSGFDVSKIVHRYWTVTNNTPGSFSTANLTFSFDVAEASGNPMNYDVRKFDAPSTWTSTTTGTRTSGSTQATGVSGFSDFAIGEVFVPTPTNTATSTPSNTATNTATPSDTATNTPTDTATNTPTPSNTATFTPTDTPTDTATNTPTPSDTATATATSTPQAEISGTIVYGNALSRAGEPFVRPVQNVTVLAVGGPTPFSGVTDSAGAYSITGAWAPGPYAVHGEKVGGQNGAITSYDAAQIAQYLTGNIPFFGYQAAVADVSGSGGLSSYDAALIARYAAALPPPTGNTGNWFFDPASYNHPDVTSNHTDDFQALLMGDVSGNWTPSGMRAANVGPERSTSVSAPQKVVAPGSQVFIPITVQNAADKGIVSYEFDLRYDPSVIQPMANTAVLNDTVSRGLNVVVNPTEPGLLRVVVYGAVPITSNGVLLNLKFTAVGQVGSISPLTWERMVFNEGDPSTTASNGQIELSYAVTDQN